MAADAAANAEFVSWVAARQHRLLRSTYLMTGDLHRAEDLLQEALIKVAERWDRLSAGNPDAYIRTVLYRSHVSWWRSRREVPVSEVYDGLARHEPDTSERQLMVRHALAQLTAKQRAVLILRYFDDLTEQQTAEILGVTRGTVKSQASVALARLRTLAPELGELIGIESEAS